MQTWQGITRTIWRALRVLRAGALLLQFHQKSYLRRRGWFRSFAERASVDGLGRDVPWWSYGVSDFVEGRLKRSMVVLEFGAGASTGWLAARVSRVVAIETSAAWAEKVRASTLANVSVVTLKDPTEFEASHLGPSADAVDLVIIDAFADRIQCAIAGLSVLRSDGVVVWDNTDGPDWPTINQLMKSHGFREISFSGLAPQEVCEDRTTIFYRPENVFGI